MHDIRPDECRTNISKIYGQHTQDMAIAHRNTDNVLIASQDLKSHEQHVTAALNRLDKNSMKTQ